MATGTEQYVVVVSQDVATAPHGDYAFGPYDGITASVIADQCRQDYEQDGVTGQSFVVVLPLHNVEPESGDTGARGG